MNSFKKLSIGTQLLFVGFIVIAIIPIIIINIYNKASEIIIEQNTQYNVELVSNIQKNISTNYTQISNILTNLGYDTTVQEFLQERDKQELYEMSKKVISLISLVKNSNEDIIDIVIINEENKYLSLNGSINVANNLMDSLKHKKGIVYYGGYNYDSVTYPQDSFLFGLNLYSSQNTIRYGEKVGFIAGILNGNSINKYIEKTPGLVDTNFYFWTNDEIVYQSINNDSLELSWDELQLFKEQHNNLVYKEYNDQRYIIQSFPIPELQGGIISVVASQHIIKDLNNLKKTSYTILIIALLGIISIYFFLTLNILQSHRELIKFMTISKLNNLDLLQTKVKLAGYAEIEVISEQFNTMFLRINQLTHQLLEANAQLYLADIERQKAEMSFLQSQIKPHFLSNTLDTIKGMALVNGNKEVFEMASALSRMLRYSIKGADRVTLKEELIIVQSYITIHQGRFPNRIHYNCFCPDHLINAKIPKMILQPLVENALTHGIEPHPNGGHLSLTVTCINPKEIEIIIEDNGVGIEDNKLRYLRDFLNEQNYSTTHKHIGIKNVHTRLQLLYGNKYGLTINSKLEEGTTIIIKIPLLYD